MKAEIYRESLLTVLFLTIFILLGIILFNYYEGPGNSFFHSDMLENKIADAFINHKKVIFPYNYNDRGVEKVYLEKLSTRPEVLVIGSSRAMPIGQDLFKNHTFYNGSVTSASLEDILSIYYLYQKKGDPKILVLSLDPWILDKNHGMKKWKFTFLSEYIAAKKLLLNNSGKLSYLEKIKIVFEKYSQLLSSEYTYGSLKKCFLPPTVATDDVIIDPIGNPCPSCFIRLPDGTRLYPIDRELTTSEEADSASVYALQQYPNDYGNYTELDKNYISIFEHFIAYLVNHHIKVIFYLPAYEPIAYSAILTDKRYAMINEAEKYFISVALKYNFQVIGGYNPSKLHLQASDFVDDLHLKKKPIDTIFKQQLVV